MADSNEVGPKSPAARARCFDSESGQSPRISNRGVRYDREIVLGQLRIRIVIQPECRQHQKARGEGLARSAKPSSRKK